VNTPRVEHLEDGELVRRAQQGDQTAFAELVRNHQNEVYTLALRLVNRHDLASDVTQEALIRAWRALPKFRGDAAFSTWLHRIVVNTAWTLRRRSRRHDAAPLDEESMQLRDKGVTPEQAGEVVDLRAALKRELGALTYAQRSAVVMKDIYGWSHEEVAEALDISVTAAKVRLHRGRKRLRDRLFEEAT